MIDSRRPGRLAMVASVVLAAVAVPAPAALVTDTSLFVSPTVYDFSAYAGCTSTFGSQAGCAPSLTLAGTGIQFTGTSGFFGSALYNGSWSLVDNGSWDSGRNGYAGNNGRETGDFARFTFPTPVSAVGGFFNYAVRVDGGIPRPFTILAYGAGNVLLESYDIETLAPISTLGGVNAGAFRGIVRGSSDIVAFEFQNGVSVVDDLTYADATAAVPEPGSLFLVASGLLGLTRIRRKA